MTLEELNAKIESLLEYRDAIDELKKEATAIEDLIKNHLVEMNVEEVSVGTHVVHYTSVLSSKFDTKRFKEEVGTEFYKKYCKEVASKRFSIS